MPICGSARLKTAKIVQFDSLKANHASLPHDWLAIGQSPAAPALGEPGLAGQSGSGAGSGSDHISGSAVARILVWY
jgi:hypothetical protein